MLLFNPTDKFNKISRMFTKAIEEYSVLLSNCDEQVEESDKKIKEQEAKKDEALKIRIRAENAIAKINEIIGE